jgi:hypothetical protein
VAGLAGSAVYFVVALRMRVEELSSVTTMVRSRLGR